ncbi:hypothetical protein [Roseivirga sp.]|uniref:hypothetical protein n=1 Tax=Roseivirga sp. TaxID=1964215 RepID=UPI003B52BE67
MKSLGRQIIESLIFSIILCGIVLSLQQIEMEKSLIHPQIWSIMIFSALLGIVVAAIAQWALTSFDAQSRPNIFIGLTVLRMLLSMIFIGAVLFIGLEERVLWVANFFVVYLFYLVFEIYTILSNLRAISGEGENQ